jgi:hypothetical protein
MSAALLSGAPDEEVLSPAVDGACAAAPARARCGSHPAAVAARTARSDALLPASSAESAPALAGRVDGGARAWLTVAASFAVHFVTLGISYSFGVFQAWYLAVSFAGRAGMTPASVAPAMSMAPGVTFLVGLFVGRMTQAWGYELVMLAGTLIVSLALFLASSSTEVLHVGATQGAVFGVGTALLYFHAVSLPTQWFVACRAFAGGMAVSNAGAGRLAVALAVAALLPSLGAAWTLRILSLSSLVLLGAAVACTNTRLPHAIKSNAILATVGGRGGE